MFYVPHNTVPRDAWSVLCPTCLEAGRLAVLDNVSCTPEELREHNCHRRYECCARAFAGECGHRLAVKIAAPEMDE